MSHKMDSHLIFFTAIFVSFIPFFIFGLCSLLATKLRNAKILPNLCLHLARQDGQDKKKITQPKVTKIQKTIILLTSSKNQIYEFRIPNIYNYFLITFDLCIHFVFLSPLSNSKCIKKLPNFHLNNKKYWGFGIRKFGFLMTWARYKTPPFQK